MKLKIGEMSTTAISGTLDAFHVPCVITSSRKESFYPGEFIRFTDDTLTSVVKAEYGTTFHGIVDPFLQTHTLPGARFYVLLSPEKAQDLRHVFTVDLTAGQTDNVVPEPDDEDDSCKGCWDS